MRFHHIGFIGLGLIGGSIARAIRKFYPDMPITAFDANPDNLTQSLSEGVITTACNRTEDGFAPAFASCDLVFLCTPVDYNNTYLAQLADVLQPGAILTDVGSVKSPIHETALQLGLTDRFIGGHPMAGSEKSGYRHSSDHLIENAYYILTPEADVPRDVVADMEQLVASLGAIPLTVKAEEHDHIVAAVSHLPHLIAAGLVNVVHDSDSPDEKMKTIAAGGFKDITRIASSSPVMWEQICLENHENISHVLDEYIKMLIQARCSVDNLEAETLYDMFANSRDYRDSIDTTSSGLINKTYVLYIDIVDEAGGIATIATILAMEGISIKNIGIIHNREFEQGVLKIEFYEEDAMKRGTALLKKRNYIVYER